MAQVPGIVFPPPWADRTYGPLFEEALTNKFVVQIPPKVPDGFNVEELTGTTFLTLSCRQAVIPNVEISTVEDNFFQYRFVFHNARANVAGTATFQFRGFMMPNDPGYIFYEWCRRVVEYFGGDAANPWSAYYTGDKSEYKVDARVFLLTHKNVPWRIYKFINLFPVSVPQITFNYEGGTLFTWNINFRYDRFVLELEA